MNKKFPLLFLLVFGVALLLAGCGATGESQNTNEGSTATPATTSESPDHSSSSSTAGDAGFREYPIGEEVEVEGMKIAAIYLQPVVMEPGEKAGLPAGESDMHLEADIAALAGNKVGFGAGEFISYLTVHYQLKNLDNSQVVEGTFMPMNAGDGAHYGANVKLPGAGKYKLTFVIESPEKMDYLLHTDKTTGVEGRFWTKPIELSWEFPWVPRKW